MTFPKRLRKLAGALRGWKCEICGRKFSQGWMIEAHHIIPTHAKGKDTLDNLRLVCLFCHRDLHKKLAREGKGHPNSARLIEARIKRTGGRTRSWIKSHKR